MARIRSVHPGLWTDEQFMSLTVEAPLAVVLLLGIWTEADDFGAFEWKPITLKARILPAANVDVDALLEVLVRNEFIRRYEIDGKQLGAVRNFCRWQKPKKPHRRHVMPPEIRTYVGISDEGSEPVPHQFPTGGEIGSLMEDGGDKREEEKENNTAPRKRAADYEFEGDVIRVNAADMRKWRRAYPDLGRSGGLEAYLTKRDIWLAKEAPPGARKSWFISTSQWLANENRKAAMELARSPPTGTGWEDPSS